MTDTQQAQGQSNEPALHIDWIDSHAVGIVKALQKAGHTSYLVGGCVRDLLLGMHPKDYDIATAAHPPQVKRLIHMAFIIGKRFRLVLVKRGDQQFEVATFRKELDLKEFPIEQFPDGPPPGDNIFGTPEEDAKRRDFTINAMFYDPISGDLIDYVGGKDDMATHTLRMIGDPEKRLIEDPIRILRAIRLTHKIGFMIEPSLRQAMATHASELKKSVLPRRREELLKILHLDDPMLALTECHDLGVLAQIFPSIEKMFEKPERLERFSMLFESLRRSVTDQSNTVQVFAWLLMSMLETWREEAPENGVWPKIDDNDFGQFMRDELGMYKFEQSQVVDAIRQIGLLQRADDYRKKGERRQSNLVRKEGFQVALSLAQADYRLTPADAAFWSEVFEKARPEIEAQRSERSQNRTARRRRRPPKRGRGQAQDGGDSDSSQNEMPEDTPTID